MYKRVIFGDVANDDVATLTDISRREFWLLAAVAAAVLVDGRLAEAVHRRHARIGRPTCCSIVARTQAVGRCSPNSTTGPRCRKSSS